MSEDSFASAFYCTCADGYARMSREAQAVLADSVAQSQTTGGLFANIAGQPDLYYSFFGLLLAAVSGAKINLRACLNALTAIDFPTLPLVQAAAYLRALGLLRLLRRVPLSRRSQAVQTMALPGKRLLPSLQQRPAQDFPQHDPGSPYSLFLLQTLRRDCGLPALPVSLSAYRLPGGLYSNFRPATAYSVNATAAALWVLPAELRGETAAALQSRQRQDGSFAAAEGVPEGDLLSTATAGFSLRRCALPLRYPLADFLRGCFRDDALFAATPGSPSSDLEYTAYGLLAMGGLP